MHIDLRSAAVSDLDTLLAMMRDLQRDDPWSCRFDGAVVRDTLSELLRNPSLGHVWLICDDAEAIGYVVLAFDYSLEYGGKGAWVDELFVQPAYRGKGVGVEALKFFEKAAVEMGVKVIHLEVNHGNPAVKLYRGLGYEDHERYLMTKWLAPRP